MRRSDTAGIAGAIAGVRGLEEFARGSSPLHLMGARAKIAATLVYIVCVVSIGKYDLSAIAPFFAYPLLATKAASIPLRAVFSRSLAALPFVAFAGAANLFFDTASFETPFGFSLPAGAVSFAMLLAKAFLTVSAAAILAATTPLMELAGGLRGLGVPCVIVLQFALTARYLETLLAEAGGMRDAYALRSGTEGAVRMRDWPGMAGGLFLRSLDRAERVYAAMQCRGFSARRLGAFGGRRERAADIAAAAAFSALCIFFREADVCGKIGGLVA